MGIGSPEICIFFSPPSNLTTKKNQKQNKKKKTKKKKPVKNLGIGSSVPRPIERYGQGRSKREGGGSTLAHKDLQVLT